MEENEIIEELEVEAIDPKLQAAIDKKVAELKAANPKLRIRPLIVNGDDEDDEKSVYVGYFSKPSFINFSKYLTLSQKDQAMAMRQLAKDCFIDGDREILDDDDLFLFGLMGQLQHLIKMRGGRLVNLSKPGK